MTEKAYKYNHDGCEFDRSYRANKLFAFPRSGKTKSNVRKVTLTKGNVQFCY